MITAQLYENDNVIIILICQESMVGTIYKRASHGCLVRVTDTVVQYINPESVFYLSLRHTESEKCDIVLVSQLMHHSDSTILKRDT
jgi:hypothetical protein